MNENNLRWIPFLVLFVFALGGIVAGVRGEHLLSGAFALYFVGYFIIRIPSILRRSWSSLPDRARITGYFLVVLATLLLLWRVVARL
jgi:hypothetical protein